MLSHRTVSGIKDHNDISSKELFCFLARLLKLFTIIIKLLNHNLCWLRGDVTTYFINEA